MTFTVDLIGHCPTNIHNRTGCPHTRQTDNNSSETMSVPQPWTAGCGQTWAGWLHGALVCRRWLPWAPDVYDLHGAHGSDRWRSLFGSNKIEVTQTPQNKQPHIPGCSDAGPHPAWPCSPAYEPCRVWWVWEHDEGWTAAGTASSGRAAGSASRRTASCATTPAYTCMLPCWLICGGE